MDMEKPTVWYGEFGSVEDIRKEFNDDIRFDLDVLFACYDTYSYEGSATVLFRENDKLYLVTGSHCSCNGLEGQWQPDEVSAPQLKKMLTEGCCFDFYASPGAGEAARTLIGRLEEN